MTLFIINIFSGGVLMYSITFSLLKEHEDDDNDVLSNLPFIAFPR